MSITEWLAHPGPNASEAQELLWLRNIQEFALVAAIVAAVAALIYLPVWVVVVLALIVLHTAYRIFTLNRRIEAAHLREEEHSSPAT